MRAKITRDSLKIALESRGSMSKHDHKLYEERKLLERTLISERDKRPWLLERYPEQ